jgi:hypothetical protein
MKHLCAILITLLAGPVLADGSVVVGTPVKQFPIYASGLCPSSDQLSEPAICMEAWVGWEIKVKKTLSGRTVMGRVRAARFQHIELNARQMKLYSLFVLKPIEDARIRMTLGADYYLEEASTPKTMYCFDREPGSYGSGDYASVVIGSTRMTGYCFDLNKSPSQ